MKLLGEDGNAFSIIGACVRAARRAHWSEEKLAAVLADMRAGNYDHLLQVACREFDVY